MKRIATTWILLFLAMGAAPASAGDQRLADAVEQKDRQAVRVLLKNRADVNGRQADGATALQWAAHWDDLEIADLLLRAGADVNAANDNGVTALALACENGSAAMVEKILAAGANANATVASGETALMTAARTGSLGALRALIARGANVNAKESSHGQTALMWAVAYGHSESVKTLVEAGADMNARSEVRRRQVHTGSRFGDRGAVKGALTMDLGGFTPLLFAASQGDIESAKVLLGAGAKVTEVTPTGASVLAIAALSGHGELAAFLMEKGADPNAAGGGYSALHAAVLRRDQALVKTLLVKGANPDAKLTQGTPSRYYSKDYAFSESLIGATPLWLAARYGDMDMIRLLAAGGADLQTTSPDGTTALMVAVASNSGFGLGDRREQYMAPADVAAKADGDDERVTLGAVRTLIEVGAGVNSANQAGDTALHIASGQGLASVVQLLADKGASLEAKNKRGLTPLAVAIAPRQRGPFAPTGRDPRGPVAELLRKLGAQEPQPIAPPPANAGPQDRPRE